MSAAVEHLRSEQPRLDFTRGTGCEKTCPGPRQVSRPGTAHVSHFAFSQFNTWNGCQKSEKREVCIGRTNFHAELDDADGAREDGPMRQVRGQGLLRAGSLAGVLQRDRLPLVPQAHSDADE